MMEWESKVEPSLLEVLKGDPPVMLDVIVQTADRLNDDDRKLVLSLGGRVKDDLYIINAWSADVPPSAVPALGQTSRVVRIYPNAEVRAL